MAVDVKRFSIWAVSLVCLFFVTASTNDSTSPTRYRRILETVPALELPTEDAELVEHAASRHRATTAAGVTNPAVTTNPPAAPGVVSAIAKAVPELAATVAVASEAGAVTGMGPSSLGSAFELPVIPRSETVKTIPPDTSGDVPTGGREVTKP
jgi:hypothetical protein